MKILGIETSCDETAAAVVKDGTELLSNVVASQADLHAQFGGVVPEVAARSHIEVMLPVVQQSLDEAGLKLDEIDAIAYTRGPGLLGSLLIGGLTAEALAELTGKPLIPVNHVEAHVYANFLLEKAPTFPLLALIVSGGHTQLVLFERHGKYQMLGQTTDDAAGEAFDKVAKMIGLPYPGGPAVSQAAQKGNASKYTLPKPKTAKPYDFSFSGLKTAVLRLAQAETGGDYTTPSIDLPGRLSQEQRVDIAASFQQTAVEILTQKLRAAYDEFQPRSVVIAGGVAANRQLRVMVSKTIPTKVNYAPSDLCTDNAAMIAALGYFSLDQASSLSHLEIVNPSLSM